MASLTKIMVTTPSIMILYDRELIGVECPLTAELEEYACKYLPEFGNNGKHLVTIHQLLTHTAGLREFYPFFDMGLTGRKEVLDYIMNDKLWYKAGQMARYSDLSMIVLGLIVERISGVSLDAFAAREVFQPLGMRHTIFRPNLLSDFDLMIVPTEVDRRHRKRLLWGEVQDPTAFLLGGVAGHAGLFSTIIDVCKFAQMMLAGGIDVSTSRRLFRETTIRLFITPDPQTATNERPFALGWDVALRRSVDGSKSAGRYLGPATFGHTGFTGTSLWIDPDRELFVALLTNAVHPTAVGGCGSKVREVRPLIADAAVCTMEEEQANPRRSLRRQLRVSTGGNIYQSSGHTEANYPYQQESGRESQHFLPALVSPPRVRYAEKEQFKKDLQLQNPDAVTRDKSLEDLSDEMVASENSEPYEGSLDVCEEPRQTSRAKIVVPVFLVALLVSIIS